VFQTNTAHFLLRQGYKPTERDEARGVTQQNDEA
jgi:hypothetical protein